MAFLDEMDPATGLVEIDKVRATGLELRERYNGAEPFAHVVIDEFLPRPIIDLCIAEFDVSRSEEQTVFDRSQERAKRQFSPEHLSPAPRAVFYSFNARPFIKVLENIIGIEGLIPDPYFLGGGLHEISTGGYLSMHTDFNHHRLMDLERRINVLIYLNDGWREDYGGQLELWDRGMKACIRSVLPEANRCVIFNTTRYSNHGNPNPVLHPEGRSRKSIALYYYTATWDDAQRAHTTRFRARPGTADASDWQLRRRELADDLLPPIVRRGLVKARRKMRGAPRRSRPVEH